MVGNTTVESEMQTIGVLPNYFFRAMSRNTTDVVYSRFLLRNAQLLTPATAPSVAATTYHMTYGRKQTSTRPQYTTT